MSSELQKADFGPDFKWGTATAAYQIEGAWDADGKGKSIWDTFSQKSKNIKDKTNGNIACDFYNRYPADLGLLKEMNFDVFRFSLSWSRIFPDGIGTVNQKGIDFYHRVIDKCLELGIEPWITTYHWDIPQALQDKGGWINRDVIGWYTEYCDKVTKAYGDKVKNWMVLNEPTAFTALGYMLGVHAPGKIKPNKFLATAHHASMVQAEGGRIIRNNVADANIGSTFSCAHVEPKDGLDKHKAAAHRMNSFLNRLYIEPVLGMGYPTDDFKFLNRINKHIHTGDEAKLKFDFDFIGLQNYTRVVTKKAMIPWMWAFEENATKRKVPADQITDMGWEVYPEGIYKILMQFNEYKNLPPVIVTENGCAFPDKVENGKVHDPQRTKFFKDYIGAVLKAKNDGMDIRGYFVWTLMDNFEWAEGYEPRFGLIHVDFDTQERIIKDSGLWFKEFLGA
ncbi:UNVERIFIED_CONTAM: hypothetical protein GTU68_065133 [Idotea baltica]|nr:hypothetical protein [Idotea baltica]